MGERALVVVPDRSDGYCLCYCSQWAGSDSTLRRVLESGQSVDELLTHDWRFERRCRTGQVLDSLDFLGTDAVYRFWGREVDVFIPLWFGIAVPEHTERADIGALVPVRSFTTVEHCREALRQFKGPVLDSVRDGTMPSDLATTLLERACHLVRAGCSPTCPTV